MHRTGRVIATMAVILMAGLATVTSGTDERLVALTGTNNAADSMPASIASAPALIVLCFPGAGCIVCHNGYCEYTNRI